MSNEKQACVICALKLKKPIMLGETAPKGWAKENGYDSYQWRNERSTVLAVFKDARPELLEPYDHGFGTGSVTYFTCMKHTTTKDFQMGEKPERNQDQDGDEEENEGAGD